MKFSVGDWVVHPEHGTGQITGEEAFNLVDGFERYFKIEILDTNLVVHVPIREMESLEVRPIMSQNRLARVWEILRSVPRKLSKDFKIRQASLQKKIKTGKPARIAEVVRDLTWQQHERNLSAGDVSLLERGRDLLTIEIAAVTDTEPIQARQTILDTLKEEIANLEEEEQKEEEQKE